MKKIFLFVFTLIGLAVDTHAENQDAFFDSKRNMAGISGDYQSLVDGGYGANFFKNELNIDFPALIADKRYDVQGMTQELNKLHVGKKVLDLLFQRQADGTMSEELLKQRALQNVLLTDRERAEVGVLDATTILKEDYLPILMNNYILLHKRVTSKKVAWIVFHVEIDQNTLNDVYAAWNDPAKYNAIRVPVTYVASGVKKNWLRNVSNKVDALAIRGQVISRHPFLAEIGSGAGIKNADRFFVYRQHRDEAGRYKSHKVATIRATQIADSVTQFYTIAGGQASYKKGDIAVFRPDKKLGHSFYFGIMDHARELSYMFDRMISMKPSGFSSHFLFNYTFGFYEGSRKTLYDFDGTLYRSPVIHDIGAGYGFGYTFAHMVQIMPYAMAQMEWQSFTEKEYGASNDPNSQYTMSARVPIGVKLNLNVVYPIQLTGGLELSPIVFMKSDKKDNAMPYADAEKYFFDRRGWKRTGLKFYVGIRWCM